jgi:hypothetical protein
VHRREVTRQGGLCTLLDGLSVFQQNSWRSGTSCGQLRRAHCPDCRAKCKEDGVETHQESLSHILHPFLKPNLDLQTSCMVLLVEEDKAEAVDEDDAKASVRLSIVFAELEAFWNPVNPIFAINLTPIAAVAVRKCLN